MRKNERIQEFQSRTGDWLERSLDKEFGVTPGKKKPQSDEDKIEDEA